jgi:hypothetical protein
MTDFEAVVARTWPFASGETDTDRDGEHNAVTVACTAWILFRLIIESEVNRSSITRSLAEEEANETMALLLQLCTRNPCAKWLQQKALQWCVTESSSDATLAAVLQYAIDTLGPGLPYTVCEIPGKGLGIIASETFSASADGLSTTIYGTVDGGQQARSFVA